MKEPWKISLFGGLRVERAGKSVHLRTRKTEILIGVLAYYKGQPISKDYLIGQLWPDATEELGKHSLRVALSSIRKSIVDDESSGELIRSDRDTLTIDEAMVWTDVGEFHRLLADAEAANGAAELELLKRAIELYSGTFFGTTDFTWALSISLEYEETYAQAVVRYIEVALETGQGLAAIPLGLKALTHCPDREDLHIALIKAYAATGQPGAALKTFEQLERMLDEQWGEQPSEEAKRALEEMPSGASISSATPTEAAPPPLRANTTFVGRLEELRLLQEKLLPDSSGPRLITLFGLGGCGKSRIAYKAYTELHSEYRGAVVFVALAHADTQSSMVEAILAALDPRRRDVDVLDAVIQKIGAGKVLLVLDNLEQLGTIARDVIEVLLEKCPGLRILATSRILTGVTSEAPVPVGPLELPQNFRDLRTFTVSPCVALLTEVAESVRPGFRVTPGNAQAVWLLCKRLEGIPLSIELAGKMLSVHTPAELNASLGRLIDIKTAISGARGEDRNIRTVLDWTIERLDHETLRAFAQLTVCSGSFPMSMASAIVGDDAEEHVKKLCGLSLLYWVEVDDHLRFAMLETVREAAQEILDRHPNLRESAIEKHCSYIHAIALAQDLETLNRERENVLEAVQHATEGFCEPEKAWEIGLAVVKMVEVYGRPQVWVEELGKLLASTSHELDDELRAKACIACAKVSYAIRDIATTYRHYRDAISAADDSGDLGLRVESRSLISTSALLLGEMDTAQELLSEAEKLLEKSTDVRLRTMHYTLHGLFLSDTLHSDEASPYFQKAVADAESLGDPALLSSPMLGLACCGDELTFEERTAMFDRVEELREQAGLKDVLAVCYYQRACIEYRFGKLSSALKSIKKALKTFVENGITLGQTPLAVSGVVMSAVGQNDIAMAFWEKSAAARKKYNMKFVPSFKTDFDVEFARIGNGVQLPSGAPILSDEELLELALGVPPGVDA